MSRYFNYSMRNNVFSELYTPISSIATTIQVNGGQGTRWGDSFPILGTLEHFEEGKCTKREIVKITGRTGDVLTVDRGFAPCPASDDANQEGTTRFSFNSGDLLSLYIPKEIFDNISDAIVDLYENGSDRVFCKSTGGLGIQITGGNVRVGSEEFEYQGGTATLNDNATNYVMLDGAGTIEISTEGRDQQKVKIATVVTNGGNITSLKQWRMDAIGGVLGGSAGFKNISNTVYRGGLLTYFVADGEEYSLTYKQRRLATIQSGQKTYTVTYSSGKLIGTVES